MTTTTRYVTVALLGLFGLILLGWGMNLHRSSSSAPSLTAGEAAQVVTKTAAAQSRLQVRTISCRNSGYVGQYGETMVGCTASYFPQPHAEPHSTIWCVVSSSGPSGPIASDEACAKLPHADGH